MAVFAASSASQRIFDQSLMPNVRKEARLGLLPSLSSDMTQDLSPKLGNTLSGNRRSANPLTADY